MPWCEDCDRFYTPSTLSAEGVCPAGHRVADADAEPVIQSGAPGRDETEGPRKVSAPWHFWVLVIAVSLYLGWRLIQGIAWLF